MNVSLDYLEQCSTGTGFGVAGLEKVVRLGAIAGEIGRHPLLSKALALKGGTALNLAFGPPERLSVDLDFNYARGVRSREIRRPEAGTADPIPVVGEVAATSAVAPRSSRASLARWGSCGRANEAGPRSRGLAEPSPCEPSAPPTTSKRGLGPFRPGPLSCASFRALRA